MELGVCDMRDVLDQCPWYVQLCGEPDTKNDKNRFYRFDESVFVREWLLQVAHALNFAHKRGVAHRDSKSHIPDAFHSMRSTR